MERPGKTLLASVLPTTLLFASYAAPLFGQDCAMNPAVSVAKQPFHLDPAKYVRHRRDDEVLSAMIRDNDLLVLAEPHHSDPDDRAYLGSSYFMDAMKKGGGRYLAIEWDKTYQTIVDHLYDGKTDPAGFVSEFRTKLRNDHYVLSGIDDTELATSLGEMVIQGKTRGVRVLLYDVPSYNADPVIRQYEINEAKDFQRRYPGDCNTEDRTSFSAIYSEEHPDDSNAADIALVNNRASAKVNSEAIARIEGMIDFYEARDHQQDPNRKVAVHAGVIHRDALIVAARAQGLTAGDITLFPSLANLQYTVRQYAGFHQENAVVTDLHAGRSLTVDTGRQYILAEHPLPVARSPRSGAVSGVTLK